MADGAGAEDKLGGDVLVGRALRGQPDDLQLLRSEVPRRALPGRPASGSGGGELPLGPLGPGDGTEPFECLQGEAEVDSRVGLAFIPAQPFAVQQPGACFVERAVARLVQFQRLAEMVLVPVKQRQAPVDERSGPGLRDVA